MGFGVAGTVLGTLYCQVNVDATVTMVMFEGSGHFSSVLIKQIATQTCCLLPMTNKMKRLKSSSCLCDFVAFS